jgi:class 3 adenylate cyclase
LRRREQLIDPKIAELSGHIVKTAGDGMLINQGCDASRVTGDLVDRSRTAAATLQNRGKATAHGVRQK